jgi:UDP-3-O-acyl-N-acetylglucosamine deacetylase
VWTTGYIVSNIVLRSGAPHNYVRMVEHMIACKLGMGVDNLTVKIDSGDPPLFNRGSLDLVEAVERAGIVETGAPARCMTVKEPVSIVSPTGSFVILRPATGPRPRLVIDAAVDFPNAIGKQRIRFTLDPKLFKDGSVARTNTSASKKFYCQTVGRIFADIRNLGYTHENILIAGRTRYANEPRLLHNGKSLEAAWHRAVLDLMAALALVEEGRFVGEVQSYKAGHALDVRLFTLLYKHDLLTDFKPSGA